MNKKKTDISPLLQTNLTSSTDRNKSDKTVIWFSRIIRWGLGALFIGGGIYYFNQGGWPAILFGTVLFVTGFFRPRRCLEEGSCEIPGDAQRN
ncbi:MAG: DUF2892 domain-containing protein [Bacteroidetes bacterium]|nr:DUF2892 domain-containing protein [Bacteroidota bacterium]